MAIYTNDEDMIYDVKSHRYILTPHYILSTYGEDLNDMRFIREDKNPATAAQRFLNMISLQFYAFIYEYANDKLLTEYLIAGGKPEWREEFKTAMGEFAYSVKLSANMFMYETGLSLDKGKEMSKEDISIQSIPIAARNILEVNDFLFRGHRRGYNMEEIRELKKSGAF